MKSIKKLYDKIMIFPTEVSHNHVGAYAAQSSYFLMLSFIPMILLFLTLVQYTPLTKADVMAAVIQVFPSSVDSMVTSIVNQVYNQSAGFIPITIIVALWSAGKGVLAMTTGLNCVYKCNETRNYVILRLRATFYMFWFILVILFLLLLSVFGNVFYIFTESHTPMIAPVVAKLLDMRTYLSPIVILVFTLGVYKFLPNGKVHFWKQLLGAIFATIGCLFFSWLFSVYVDLFKGFADMYGSLTTIVLIMLWMYFCMYCILLGGQVNQMVYEWGDAIRERRALRKAKKAAQKEDSLETLEEDIEEIIEEAEIQADSEGE